MHDSVFFEDQGIPTATVISTEFKRAARAQADAVVAGGYDALCRFVLRGFNALRSLTRDEVRALADKAYDEIVARLTRA